MPTIYSCQNITYTCFRQVFLYIFGLFSRIKGLQGDIKSSWFEKLYFWPKCHTFETPFFDWPKSMFKLTPPSISIQVDYNRCLANSSFPVLLPSLGQYFFYLQSWKLGKPYWFWSFQWLEKKKHWLKTFTSNCNTYLICNPTVQLRGAILFIVNT